MKAIFPVLLLLLLLSLSGCTKLIPGAGPETTATDTSTSTAGPPLGAVAAKFTWTPQFPRVDATISFAGRVENLGTKTVEAWGWTWGDGQTSQGRNATHAYGTAGDRVVTLRAALSDGKTVQVSRTVLVLAVGEAPPPPGAVGNETPPPGPVSLPGEFSCPAGNVTEATETFGQDTALPGLAWAVLKSGFRFAVVWRSDAATTGSISFTVDGGAPQSRAESVSSKVHLFVVDGLKPGATLCFTATEGSTTTPLHAVRLVNAMTAFDERLGTTGGYTVNYLVLVNEGGDLGEVQPGMDRYADMLWDATDGHVRAGAVLVVANDPLHHNSGWASCYVPGASTPACNRIFDVIFTEDALPIGAASTYRQGVTDPDAAIWMNMHFQAVPGPVTLDDTGAVLTHESGHYLFDMADLYGDPVVPDSIECDVAKYDISIMGGSRSTTEFDSVGAPCPNQGAGYVPSWDLMRGQFPRIPERLGEPDKGPEGNGGVYFRQTYSNV